MATIYNKPLLFILLPLVASCNQSTDNKIIGKWYGSSIEKIDNVSSLDKGITEYKQDHTFITIDTISTIYNDEAVRLGDLTTLDNNMLILKVSGTWQIKDNYIISTCTDNNAGIDTKGLNVSEKIIELTSNVCITEDEKHKQSTSTKVQ